MRFDMTVLLVIIFQRYLQAIENYYDAVQPVTEAMSVAASL
jgi:hypothetical protein